MFFIASKILGVLVAPLNALLIAATLAVGLLFTRFSGLARWLLIFCIVPLMLIGFTRIADLPLIWLEERYQSPEPLSDIVGIIVLGGGIGVSGYNHPQDYYIGSWADRLTTGLALKARFPQARLIYSGGSAALGASEGTEADAAEKLVVDLFGDNRGMEQENLSRNTWENGVETLKMIGPSAMPEKWVLVTSAWHMERALGVYRKLGFVPVAYSTDYKAAKPEFPYLANSAVDQWDKFSLAVRELIGLLAYRLSGRWSPQIDPSRQ